MNNYLIVVLNKLCPIDRKHRLTNKRIFVERRIVIIIFYIYNSMPLVLPLYAFTFTPQERLLVTRRRK